MAEGVGFEPTVRLHVQRFSRPPRSTAPASLRWLAAIAKRRERCKGNAALGQGHSKNPACYDLDGV